MSPAISTAWSIDAARRTGARRPIAASTSEAASPIATTARTGGTVLASSERSSPLLRPPAISTTEENADTPARTAAGVVAFESSYQRTPSRSATNCTRCGGGAVVRAAIRQHSSSAPAAMATARAAAALATSWGKARGSSDALNDIPPGPSTPSGPTVHVAPEAPKLTTRTPGGTVAEQLRTTGSSALITAVLPSVWWAQILAFARL